MAALDSQGVIAKLSLRLGHGRSAMMKSAAAGDYWRLFEDNPHAMWIFDLETLAFLDVNKAAIRRYGYSRDDFRGMTIKDIRPATDVPRLLAHVSANRDSPSSGTTLWRHRTRDGTVVDVEITSFKVTFADRPAKLVTVDDVTESRRAEARARFQALLLCTISDAVVSADLDLIVTGWNRAAEVTYGWKAEEVLGRSSAEVFRTEFIDTDRNEIIPRIAETGEWRGEVIQCCKDGRRIHVEARSVALHDADGRPIGYVSVNRDVTDRKRAEGRIRTLLGRAVTAQEDERRRIARELHDGTAQSLTSLLVGLRALEEAGSLEAAREAAREARKVVANTLEEVQRTARGLRPSVLDDLGLVEALDRLGDEASKMHGISVDVQATDLDARRLPTAVETTFYRIAQEALANAVQHAAAKMVSILVRRTASCAQLIVEDDGCGFDVGAAVSSPHWGLQGMRERAALLSGSCSIESTREKGTAIYVSVPIEERS